MSDEKGDFFPSSPPPPMATLPAPPSSEAPEADELLEDEMESGDESDPSVLRISGALDPPHTMTYTTLDLHRMVHEAVIDLDPPWQRDVVWNDNKQSHLINSLFTNYPIPPIILARIFEDNQEYLVCVDGKQRLTSVSHFMDGVLAFKDRSNPHKWYYSKREDDTKKMVIPQGLRKEFNNKELTCVIYENLQPGEERDIFQRVQLGVALTTAEKLAAIDSPYSNWASEIMLQQIHIEGGLGKTLDWDIKRSKGHQNICQLIYCCEQEDDNVIPTVANKVYQYIAQDREPPQQLKKDLEGVLDDMLAIATENSYKRVFEYQQKKLAPVEFVYLGVLLYVIRDADMAVKAKAAYRLRKYVRTKHKDIRMNTAVGKSMWEIITLLREEPGYIEEKREPKSSSTKKRSRVGDEGSSRPKKK